MYVSASECPLVWVNWLLYNMHSHALDKWNSFVSLFYKYVILYDFKRKFRK